MWSEQPISEIFLSESSKSEPAVACVFIKIKRKVTVEGLQENIFNRCILSYGSVCELETQLLLSRDLDYLGKQSFEKVDTILREVERMLKALIKSVERT
jgi:hypothetical protein